MYRESAIYRDAYVLFQCLEASDDIVAGTPLMEYIGKVVLREQYDKENIFFKM